MRVYTNGDVNPDALNGERVAVIGDRELLAVAGAGPIPAIKEVRHAAVG